MYTRKNQWFRSRSVVHWHSFWVPAEHGVPTSHKASKSDLVVTVVMMHPDSAWWATEFQEAVWLWFAFFVIVVMIHFVFLVKEFSGKI